MGGVQVVGGCDGESAGVGRMCHRECRWWDDGMEGVQEVGGCDGESADGGMI